MRRSPRPKRERDVGVRALVRHPEVISDDETDARIGSAEIAVGGSDHGSIDAMVRSLRECENQRSQKCFLLETWRMAGEVYANECG
jgi:hypothetical protein